MYFSSIKSRDKIKKHFQKKKKENEKRRERKVELFPLFGKRGSNFKLSDLFPIFPPLKNPPAMRFRTVGNREIIVPFPLC